MHYPVELEFVVLYECAEHTGQGWVRNRTKSLVFTDLEVAEAVACRIVQGGLPAHIHIQRAPRRSPTLRGMRPVCTFVAEAAE